MTIVATNGLEMLPTRNGVSAAIGSPAALATPATAEVVVAVPDREHGDPSVVLAERIDEQSVEVIA